MRSGEAHNWFYDAESAFCFANLCKYSGYELPETLLKRAQRPKGGQMRSEEAHYCFHVAGSVFCFANRVV